MRVCYVRADEIEGEPVPVHLGSDVTYLRELMAAIGCGRRNRPLNATDGVLFVERIRSGDRQRIS